MNKIYSKRLYDHEWDQWMRQAEWLKKTFTAPYPKMWWVEQRNDGWLWVNITEPVYTLWVLKYGVL